MPLREALLTVACLCVALASQTQEPFCPRTVLNAANRHTPVQVGLSGYSFHEVFGASAADMASRGLQCSEVCDGLALADSMRCSGPHACGRRTCLMGDGERVPRACPAEAVTGAESAEELAAKVGEECVECEKCEGRGCARECSQLLCYDGQVYDWTTRQCHACTDLRNPELCAASNGFAQRRVSGDVPQVRFDGCVPRGESTLLDVRYGSCQECPFQTCAHDQFPDHGCVCSPCMRAGASHGFYFDENGALAVTYCQAMACEPGRVGVHPDGVTCKRVCAPRVCGAGERLVPCRHPIDTLCVANWPPLLRTKSMWSNASYTYAQLARVLETNLLESSVASGFASFENALVDTLESLPDNHIQCVYNARNVFEDMHPGGVSVHFTGMEGKTCRERETYASSRRPLLPLQNVAALGHGTPITQRVRRVHADTPARAALWSFNGVSHDADVPDTAPAPRREGAAANEVYLIVDTLGESGRVRVPVIDDRGLRHWPFGWRVQFWALDVDPDPDSAASAALDIVAQVVAGIEVESMLPDSTLDLLAPGAWTERGDEVLSGVYEAQPAGCASVYVSVEPASATRIAECEQQDYSSYYNPCSTYSPLWRAARLFSLSVNASSTLELVSFLPPDTTSVHFIRNSNLGLVVRPSELMLLKENSDQTQGLHLELQPWRSAVAGLRYTHGVVVNDAIVIDGGYRDLILYNMLSSDGNSTWKAFYVNPDLSLISLQIVVEHPAWTQNIIAMASHHFELVIAVPSFAQENSNCTSLNCVQLYVCSLFGDVSGKQLIVHDTRSSQDSAFMESMSTDLKVSAMDVTVIRSNADHHSEYWEITTVFVYMQEENGYEYVYARVCPFKGRPGKRSDVCLRTADGQLASRRLVQKKSSVPVTQLSVAWVGAHHSLADAVVSAAGRRYVVRVYKTHFELRERFYGPPAGKYTTVLFDDTFIIRSDYPGAMLVLQPDPQQPGGDLRLSLLVPPPWTRLQSPSPAQAVLKLGGADCKFSTRSGLRVDGNSISSIADVFRTQTAQLRSPSVLEFGDAHGNSRNAHGYSRNAHGHSRLEGNLLRIPDLTIHGVLMGYLETAQAAHLGDARLTLRNETVLIKATRNSGSFRFEAKVAGAVVDLRVLDAGALWWGEVSSAGIKIKNTTSGAVVSTQSYAAQELVVEMTLVGDASWTLERVDVELLTSVSRKTVSVSKEAWTLVAGSLPAGSDVPPRLDIIVNGSSAAIAIDDVSLQARVGPGSTVVIDAATVAKWEELGLAVQSTAGGAGWRRVHVMVLAAAGGPPAQAVQVRPVQSARSVFCGTGEACVLEVPASWLPLRVDGILLEVVPAPVQWECAPDEHHHNGRCEACGGVCAPGTYDDRCAALESDVTCAHACPNDLPDAAAVYLPGWFLRDGVCPWTCVSGYVRRFADERDGNGCVPCSHVDCEPGFEPGTCSGSTDTVCEPCDVSRFGDFWQNERFTAGCNTTCVDGTFRVQGVCMPCSTPAELLSGVVREEGVFYAFEACSANADTRAVACATVPNGRAVADAGAAGEACPFACDVGFRATSEVRLFIKATRVWQDCEALFLCACREYCFQEPRLRVREIQARCARTRPLPHGPATQTAAECSAPQCAARCRCAKPALCYRPLAASASGGTTPQKAPAGRREHSSGHLPCTCCVRSNMCVLCFESSFMSLTNSNFGSCRGRAPDARRCSASTGPRSRTPATWSTASAA